MRVPWGVVIGLPAAMAIVAALLVAAAGQAALAALLLCLWGFFATAVPIGWGAWIANHFSTRAEIAGGFQVAVIQLAIMSGSATGGAVFDAYGWQAPLVLAVALLAGATITSWLTARNSKFNAS